MEGDGERLGSMVGGLGWGHGWGLDIVHVFLFKVRSCCHVHVL